MAGLLLSLLAGCSALAAEPLLSPPKPAPVRRADLEEGFTKPRPTSIAELKAMERRVKDLVHKVSPAVVAVEIDGSSGSGVVISADGLVLTAGHVASEADRRVRFTFPDGKTVRGLSLGAADYDTGLMRITEPGPWPYVPLGDLNQAQPGDWVLALGHPGGFDLRRSLVVRLGRIIRILPDILQTDCTISLGDSGGPLFDMHGRVIGIHSAINASLVGNFHVPINEFYDEWQHLAKATLNNEPRTVLAYVGAKGSDTTQGCRLSTVEENSPASKAGLRVGDLVMKVEGREIKAAAVFRRWLEEAEPGETLHLEVKRGEQLLSMAVAVGKASPSRSRK